MCRVLEIALRPQRDRLDTRAARRAQLLLADGLGEGAPHEIAHDLGAHLVAKLLGDDREWSLARTKPLEARRSREPLEALLHLLGDLSSGDRDFETSRQPAGFRKRDFHQFKTSAPQREPVNRRAFGKFALEPR